MTRFFAVAAILALLCVPAWARAVKVIDGDTIIVDGEHWRLCGINAPERNELGGAAASAYMLDLVSGHEVVCEPACNRHDRYGRHVGFCKADGHDLGKLMIDAGHACRWTRYDKAGVYAGEVECGW